MSQFKLHAFVLLILAAVTLHGRAANYQFVNIVDDAGPFKVSFGRPAINNSGTVAFRADRDAGGNGIFVGSGGPITTLYDSSGPFSGFDSPDLNDSGTVAFSAELDAGGSGVFTGNGGPTTTIKSGIGPNRINNQGTVAFSDANLGVFVGSGGPVTTIADTSELLSSNLGATSFNDIGTVGFRARLDAGGEGIFTGNGGPITTVALPGEFYPYALVQDVQVNNAGTVAFQAVLHDLGDSVGAIFVGSPGSLTMVVDDYGPFERIEPDIGLNNSGQVAFKAALDAGGEGIFTGPDPVADKVIQLGDALFGSTVTYLLFVGGLNDNGEIAFRYDLANGISGIALARPATGDFNNDGRVDAADYIVWRKSGGSLTEYNQWRADFGDTTPTTPGDFNADGVFDAADYVVWRKSDGTPTGFNLWRSHVGEPAGSGAALPSANLLSGTVPEPDAALLLLVGAVGAAIRVVARRPR